MEQPVIFIPKGMRVKQAFCYAILCEGAIVCINYLTTSISGNCV